MLEEVSEKSLCTLMASSRTEGHQAVNIGGFTWTVCKLEIFLLPQCLHEPCFLGGIPGVL